MKQWKLDNTYFMAKTLSERLVMSYNQRCFPVCIVRPSLIGCVAAEPFPGYIGNTSGFTAMVLGSLAGEKSTTQVNCRSEFKPLELLGSLISSVSVSYTLQAQTDLAFRETRESGGSYHLHENWHFCDWNIGAISWCRIWDEITKACVPGPSERHILFKRIGKQIRKHWRVDENFATDIWISAFQCRHYQVHPAQTKAQNCFGTRWRRDICNSCCYDCYCKSSIRQACTYVPLEML